MEDLIAVLRTPPICAGPLPRQSVPIPLPASQFRYHFRRRLLSISPQATIIPLSLPNRPSRPPAPDLTAPFPYPPSVPPPPEPPDDFGPPLAHPDHYPNEDASASASHLQEKFLFLDSIGIDLLSKSTSPPHTALLSTPLPSIRTTLNFLLSAGFTPSDLGHICRVCPDILSAPPSSLAPVLTFLLREARVRGVPGLRRAVRARPRLLLCDVASRLRPTLYFLQMLGVVDVARHAHILSSSVETRLLPRVLFLEHAGLGPGGSRAAVKRFPQLMCYSIDGNLAPKLEYLVGVMGREVVEVRRFPQYFSFSLDRRIRPRHDACADRGVQLELPAMLKPSESEFSARLEVCVGSTPPLCRSPLSSVV